MSHGLNRRQALGAAAGAGVCAAGLGFAAGPALAVNGYAEEIIKFTGGTKPIGARVKLDLPELAENGNTVSMAVKVDGPTTAESHLEEIVVLAPNNPNARVMRFRFSAMSVPEAATRIRLAEPQYVLAVAEMNDGALLMTKIWVEVATNGCT